jgi:hypothetical protein
MNHRDPPTDSATLISWRDVPLYYADGVRCSDADRAHALAEFRRAECMFGVFMCDPTEHDNPEDVGPSVNQIDWTGFDAL